MFLPKLEVGMYKVIQKKITEEDTAINFGSGAIKDLLATPILAALMIEAAVTLVDPLLPENYITVGKILNINHLQATAQGINVTVNASISGIADNKIVFEITAYDELGKIGEGHHERYIINNKLLNEKVAKRTEILKPRLK